MPEWINKWMSEQMNEQIEVCRGFSFDHTMSYLAADHPQIAMSVLCWAGWWFYNADIGPY